MTVFHRIGDPGYFRVKVSGAAEGPRTGTAGIDTNNNGNNMENCSEQGSGQQQDMEDAGLNSEQISGLTAYEVIGGEDLRDLGSKGTMMRHK